MAKLRKMRESGSVRTSVHYLAQGRLIMRRALAGFCWLASLWAVVPAHAQQAVKVGLIMAYSGQFTDAAAQMDNGVKLYMKQHGDTVAGRKIRSEEHTSELQSLRQLVCRLLL